MNYINSNKVISFKSFLLQSFDTVTPGTEYLDNWHIDKICHYLKKVEEGKIKRLVINIPPRMLKSTAISVAWPAWLLAKNPTKKIIVASYSNHLSHKHSQDTRLILNSNWYQKYFPKTQITPGDNRKSKFITTKQGFRFATSVCGSLTGEGGDILIVDDPHTPLQAMSKTKRKRALKWYDQTFSTRLNDKKKGAIVVIMQRLHQDDLSGYLLKKGHWKHLNLSAIHPDEGILNPQREGSQEIDTAKIDLGSYGFNSQYQQKPTAADIAIIKPSWIQRYQKAPENPDYIYQSWDTAMKIGTNNDYSVCTTWYIKDNYFYLIDVIRERLEFPELKQKFAAMYEKYNPTAVIVEDKASGGPLIQEIRSNTTIPVLKFAPDKSKAVRLFSVSSLFEAGKVYFPENAHWLADLEYELFAFPNGAYDDQVDSLSQFLAWYKWKQRQPVPMIHFF